MEKVNKRRLVICWYGKRKVSKKILSDKREALLRSTMAAAKVEPFLYEIIYSQH